MILSLLFIVIAIAAIPLSNTLPAGLKTDKLSSKGFDSNQGISSFISENSRINSNEGIFKYSALIGKTIDVELSDPEEYYNSFAYGYSVDDSKNEESDIDDQPGCPFDNLSGLGSVIDETNNAEEYRTTFNACPFEQEEGEFCNC